MLLLVLLAASKLSAQETMAVGQIINSTDNSPIPGVNVYFKNSSTGVQSDQEGYFLIRITGKETTLVFSSVGFKSREIKIKPGQSIGIDVKLEEESTLLQDVLVIPGSNPALEWMKKVRLMKKENDISRQIGYSDESTEQNLVLLSKIKQPKRNKLIYDQLKKGNLSTADSSLVIPLYMAENTYQLTDKKKNILSKNIFSSPEKSEQIIAQLVGETDSELNFYDNAISVFGKSIISPLSNVGNIYYNYYLADSIITATGKQYEIHFRTKNSKNLAFNGILRIDSLTLALTSIDAELPTQANINFIHNLHISQIFQHLPDKHWTRHSEETALNMNYELLADSLNQKPEIFIKRSATYNPATISMKQNNQFAQSEYSASTLDEKLKDLNNTPILRTAKWLADVMFTGYMQIGKIDVGKVQRIIRITDLEGLRLTLPFRTNEKLWKSFSLGGSVGYGFKNEAIKYSALADYKFPTKKRRIIGISYNNDYRRVDYNYNDYMFRENPLITGDEDISSSVLAFKSAGKMSERKEFSLTLSNEWNRNIETNVYFRSNEIYSNPAVPIQTGFSSANSLSVNSATVSTRFSFDEKKYDDYMQRIYISNYNPVFYATAEAGQYILGGGSGNYAKIIGSVKQNVKLDIGQFNYIAEAGWIFGNVPYPLLEMPAGSETGGYSTYQYNMMNYGEYATDKYITLHTELMLNGLIMNQIPLIKNLNLREMASFNLAYGSLNDSHKLLLDFPAYMNPLKKPYMEVGIGLTNILHIFTLQSVWRLTDLNRAGVVPWGIRGCLSLSF